MRFTYKGRDAQGAIVTGTINAASKADALASIRDGGTTPIIITEKKGRGTGTNILLVKSVKLSEKITFTKNLAGMLRAGLPLSRSLDVLARQVSNTYFHAVITTLLATIDKGGTLSEGLALYPHVFSPLFVAMVKSGEESGALPESLAEIGLNLKQSYDLNRKVKSAMMYPMIIIGAIVVIGILMFIYVIPTLTKTFTELAVALPLSTRIIIGISDAIAHHFVLLSAGGILVVAVIVFGVRVPGVRRMIDRIVVRLPVFGTLIREINAARTARTLASLLAARVDIGRAIAITMDVLQNTRYKIALAEAMHAIEKGEPMSAVFKRHPRLYPAMMGEMVEVGEETGNLSGMLLDIAVFYEGEVDAKTKDLSTIIEPVLMVLIGAGVGFFAISILSPMYSIMDSIK